MSRLSTRPPPIDTKEKVQSCPCVYVWVFNTIHAVIKLLNFALMTYGKLKSQMGYTGG